MADNQRIGREKKTVEMMIRLFCREQHGSGRELCPECRELFNYAVKRLDHCKFGAGKPTCGKCSVHCYKPDFRQQIVKVMRYSGPKLIYHHPLIALRHLVEGMKSKQASKTK